MSVEETVMQDETKPELLDDADLDSAQGAGTVAAHEIAHIDRAPDCSPTTTTGENAVRHMDITTKNRG